jgi:hypothetical protein
MGDRGVRRSLVCELQQWWAFFRSLFVANFHRWRRCNTLLD